MAVMSASRLLLAWVHADRFTADTSLLTVFARGWHFDLIVVSAVCAVVLFIQCLAPTTILNSTTWRRAMTAWFAMWLMLIVWNEAATPNFIEEFGLRPNRLYVEYLGNPTEVAQTIWSAHRAALLAGISMTLLAGALAWRFLHPGRHHQPAYPVRLLALAPLLLLALTGARGSTGHRPLSISFAASSTDSLVNDLALNSTYSASHALFQMLRERRVIEPYSHLPLPEVIRRVRSMTSLPEAAFTDPARPTLHDLVPANRSATRPNLVILLQESLGAHYVASLGGAPVTQKIDRWRGRSFWFDQLYATGTRSARGLEAVLTGFPPTRAPSVLKLEGAQHGFFTLASALKAMGYRTEFIYGGDSTFDNMRRFFLGNGFDRVIDQSDMMSEARFATTWGVSDEDLYARVHREVSAHARDGQPFLTVVFSTSNHPPYDFPDGRIELYEQPKRKMENAARYADFAVGSYLETAERSAYWANTLFMVVADHESRTVGEGLVPVTSFHIPGFIAGGPVRPYVVSRIASQVDLVPTVLSLMNIHTALPAVGLDQTRADLTGPGWAVMQFHESAAYRVGNDVVVLTPGQAPRDFTLAGERLVPAPARPEIEGDALAYTQFAVMAYESGWYAQPPDRTIHMLAGR